MIIEGHILSDIESRSYTIKFAKTEHEVEAALRLRYNVFKEELGRNFQFKNNIDKDEFDDQSHHLLVVDNESDNIIGTYRLQTFEQAIDGNGFVCNKRFHLEQFPENVVKNAVEVGRACISKSHRNGRVLYLLWKGFAGYLTHFKKRYLFGHAALGTKNRKVALNTYQYIQEHDFLHSDYQIEVREKFKIENREYKPDTKKIDIPPLLQNYLDVGTYICSRPSFEKESGLTHFLILLDIENISERTRKLFFG